MSSICEQATGWSDQEYWRALMSRISGERVPFSGSLALTHRCNLRCLHCYAREDQTGQAMPELDTEQWKRIIAETKEAGCLFLLLTGGEPLLRGDFTEIYSFAKKSGMMVTVFTNGALLGGRLIDMFRELPPRMVEISLYGASEGTHDRITGVGGSFRLARRAIEALLEAGLPVSLKSVLMKLNLEEISGIEKIAAEYNARFRFDPAIFPGLKGDRAPLGLRVPPEKAVAFEFADPDRARRWREYDEKNRHFSDHKNLYICGAGRRSFHVDPLGYLYPCLMVRDRRYFLPEGKFQAGWGGEIARVLEEEIDPRSPCNGCGMKRVCGYCPGFFAMENGKSREPAKYLCDIGKARRAAIGGPSIGG